MVNWDTGKLVCDLAGLFVYLFELSQELERRFNGDLG
jgi:hypothetical protein